jgi:hypothetical protein
MMTPFAFSTNMPTLPSSPLIDEHCAIEKIDIKLRDREGGNGQPEYSNRGPMKRHYAIIGMVFSVLVAALITARDIGLLHWSTPGARSIRLVTKHMTAHLEQWWCGEKRSKRS